MANYKVIAGEDAQEMYGVDRVVQHWYGDGESWQHFYIRSRQATVEAFRKFVKLVYSFRQAYGIVMNSNLEPAHGGYRYVRPGFVHAKNRRFIVLGQMGGLDI